MPRRTIAIEMFAPIEGIHTELSPSMIDVRSSPSMTDCNAFFGVIQKDYGTSLYPTSTATQPAAPVNLIFQAEYPGNTILEAFTHTAMIRYTNSASGWATNDGQTYTGTFTDCWSACMHNDEMFYTNGVDTVQAKLAYDSTGTNWGAATSSALKAYAVVSFADHLNFYHTEESGSESYKRVRWTDVGALGHTSTDLTGGTAGFLDIQDGEGALLTAEQLGGGAVVLYFEGSIHLQEWIGGSSVYRFTKMVGGLDIPCRRCVQANGDIHYVMTRENIYEYRGGRDFVSIGDAIRDTYIANMNSDNMTYAFLQFIREDNELRVYIPTGSNTHPDTCYICKVNEGYKWFRDERDVTAKGETTRANAVTIGDLVGNIGAQTWKFGDMILAAGAPTYLLADHSGKISQVDKTRYSVVATGTSVPQSFVFETKDFSANQDMDPELKGRMRYFDRARYAEHDSRWIGVKAEAKGDGSLYMDYSTDGGSTWSTAPEGAKTLGVNWELHRWDVDVASELFRARLTNSATNEVPHIRYAKVEFVPGSEVGE